MKFTSIKPEQRDGAQFDKLVSERHSFVKFYHPMCGHCQNMASAWNALKSNSKLTGLDINIIEVHVDAAPYIKSSVARIAEGQGVPFILMVNKKGEGGAQFNAERSADNMVRFILNNLQQSGGIKRTKKTGHKSKNRSTEIISRNNKNKSRKVKKTKKHVRKPQKSLTI